MLGQRLPGFGISRNSNFSQGGTMMKPSVPFRSAVLFSFLSTVLSIVYPAKAQIDPGTPDYVTVGNLSGAPIAAIPGSQIHIPVWAITDDSVAFIHIPLATENAYIVSRDGGTFSEPVSLWDDRSFLNPDSNSHIDGYTSQSALGFWCLQDPCPQEDLIFTNSQWQHIMDFLVTVTSDTAAIGATTRLMEGNGGICMINCEIIAFMGSIKIVSYFPGDVNSSSAVNGIDVIFMVNFLKGSGPAPDPYLRGDANGDCAFNGLDVIYLVNYLKGIGDTPIPGDCE